MKSILLFLFIISLIFINLSSSFANKDSLWTIWEDESQVDTVRLDALYNLTAKYYYLNKPDSAVILFNKYLDYAEAIEQDERIALGLRLVGASYQMSGNNELSLSYFQKAYDKSLEVGNMDGAVKSLLNMNIVYNSLGKWKEVIENSEKLLPKLEATQDWGNISILNSTLFNIYSDRGLHEEALKIALENYDLIPRIDESYHLTIIRDLGRCYDEVGEFNQAKKYYLKTLALAEKRGENTYVLSTLEMLLDFSTSQGDTSNIADYILKGERLASALKGSQSAITWKYELGDYYMTNGMYRKAESLFETAITSAKLSNIVYLIPYLEHAIGMNALKMSNFEKATENCKKSYDSSKNQLQNEKMTQLNCDCLHKAYKALGQATKALPYLEESYALRDSLFNEETTKATTRLTMQYEFDQEKQETDLLYQAELQRQSFIQYGLLGGLSLLALLAFVIYRNYRNTAKTKQVIEAQKNELEELNATKDRLFAIIGHDLRKPSIAFRGIGKKVDYLLAEQDYNTLGKLSQSLEKAAFSLNSLLDNLLNWALQQRNVLPYQPQVIDVAKATEDIYQQFQSIAAEKGVDLQFDLSEDTQVFADPNAFTTIVRNLVDNAIKFTPKQGAVTISDARAAEKVVLKVADTGVGMDKAELAELFQLKGKKSRRGTNGEAGTGLGLTLVQELVKLNKGSIQVNSQAQKGTVFEVALPMGS